jgi:hypothetical protein
MPAENDFFKLTFDALQVGEIMLRVVTAQCDAIVALDG